MTIVLYLGSTGASTRWSANVVFDDNRLYEYHTTPENTFAGPEILIESSPARLSQVSKLETRFSHTVYDTEKDMHHVKRITCVEVHIVDT